MGGVAPIQAPASEANRDGSEIDAAVSKEVEQFKLIGNAIVSEGISNKYYDRSEEPRFKLKHFWTDHKGSLPIHFGVYVADVGCKKSASANVETVFSGAGKFTEEAPSAGADLLRPVPSPLPHQQFRFLTCWRSVAGASVGFTTTPSTSSSARQSKRWSTGTTLSTTHRHPRRHPRWHPRRHPRPRPRRHPRLRPRPLRHLLRRPRPRPRPRMRPMRQLIKPGRGGGSRRNGGCVVICCA